jgi:hypothetical protein
MSEAHLNEPQVCNDVCHDVCNDVSNAAADDDLDKRTVADRSG